MFSCLKGVFNVKAKERNRGLVFVLLSFRTYETRINTVKYAATSTGTFLYRGLHHKITQGEKLFQAALENFEGLTE